MSEVADGLHRRNITNGDIKATNILVNDEHEASITDFGSCRVPGESGPTTKSVGRTGQWNVNESILSCSEEEYIPRVTAASDVWAVDMTLQRDNMPQATVAFDVWSSTKCWVHSGTGSNDSSSLVVVLRIFGKRTGKFFSSHSSDKESSAATRVHRNNITNGRAFGHNTINVWDAQSRYRFKQSHLKFLSTFADVRERPGWILPTAAKVLVNITQTEDIDTWSGQVEGSEECGMFLSNSVEPA